MTDNYKSGRTIREPLVCLVDHIAEAAEVGWGQTARMAALLIVGSTAVALIVMASR